MRAGKPEWMDWLCVGNPYSDHKSLHKYTSVAMNQDEVEVKSVIDLVLIKKDTMYYVHDVREMG